MVACRRRKQTSVRSWWRKFKKNSIYCSNSMWSTMRFRRCPIINFKRWFICGEHVGWKRMDCSCNCACNWRARTSIARTCISIWNDRQCFSESSRFWMASTIYGNDALLSFTSCADLCLLQKTKI